VKVVQLYPRASTTYRHLPGQGPGISRHGACHGHDGGRAPDCCWMPACVQADSTACRRFAPVFLRVLGLDLVAVLKVLPWALYKRADAARM